MANLHLVTGYAGREHVTAADQGAFNIAMLGSGQFVIDKGKKLAASIVSNNQIRVQDGDIYMQGRFIRLNEGNYADLVIENGTQGYLRNDLIVARYTKAVETGIEEVNLVVIKGTAVASNAKDPSYSSGDIIEGKAYLNDMPLYRVVINGLTVQSLVPLFTVKKCITAADVGAVALDGSNAMTAKLKFAGKNEGAIEAGISRGADTIMDISLGRLGLRFDYDTYVNDGYKLSGAVYLRDSGTGGVSKLLTTGNKPSGSYTGNGSASREPIDTKGIGNVCIIYGGAGIAIVTANGAICGGGDGSATPRSLPTSAIRFNSGVLTIKTADSVVNGSGGWYDYYVL